MSSAIAKNVLTAIDLLAKICQNKDLKVTLEKSTKAAIISGAGAFLGGLLLGGTGILIGGVMCTGLAAYTCSDFMSLPQILRNLKNEQKKESCEAVGTGIEATLRSGDFMPLEQVLRNLEDGQKKELCELLCDKLNVSMNKLTSILNDQLNYFVIDIVLELLKNYILKEKNLKVVEN